jgi:hypothetical protein
MELAVFVPVVGSGQFLLDPDKKKNQTWILIPTEVPESLEQGCGSGSGLDPDSMTCVDPDPWARKMKKKMHFSLTFLTFLQLKGMVGNSINYKYF